MLTIGKHSCADICLGIGAGIFLFLGQHGDDADQKNYQQEYPAA